MAAIPEHAVWPRPQEIRFTGKTLRLRKPLAVRAMGGVDWVEGEAANIASYLNRELGTTVAKTGTGARGGGPSLTLTDMDHLPKTLRARAVRKEEGYVLVVSERAVTIAGVDARGLFHGAVTLAQLLHSGDGGSAPTVKVRDWPAFPIRGLHMYLPPRERFDFFKRVLDYLAYLKMNTIILELGGGMELKRHPEINKAWEDFCKTLRTYDPRKPKTRPRPDSLASPEGLAAMGRKGVDKRHPHGPNSIQWERYFYKNSTHTELAGGTFLTQSEVKMLIREAKKRHIEIIPEVQSLSHSYWLCYAHPEIREREDDPFPDAYCPSNPKTYELLFDVMDEVISVFKPRMMHCGHDEAYSIGVCPECSKKTGYELYAGDVTKIHDFLASKGVRMIIWGDKLMNYPRKKPSWDRHATLHGVAQRRTDPTTGKKFIMPATWKAVEIVPNDILICDWYWIIDPRSERYFKKRGFEVMFGNWSPMRMDNWQTRGVRPGNVRGAELSSWCEVSPYAYGHNGTLIGFYPGSDTLWYGERMPEKQVQPIMEEEVPPLIEWVTDQDRWLVRDGSGTVTPLDLGGAARELPPEWQGELRIGRECATTLGTGRWVPAATRRGAVSEAVVLDPGHPATPESVRVDQKASRLLFLHGNGMKGLYHRPTYYSLHRPPAEILRYVVTWADGRRETVPVLYGDDIWDLKSTWSGRAFHALPVNAGKGRTLYALEWVNPRPGTAIKTIRAELGPDADEEGVVVVAAISAVS